MSYDVISGMDRRQFITVGLAAGAGALTVASLSSALVGIIGHGPRFTPAAELNHQRLSPLAGDSVKVSGPTGAPSELTVERVTSAAPYVSSNGRLAGDSFSIFFEGPVGAPLDQNTYELRHPSLGAFPVFLTPVGLTDGANQRYEAVFNRLR